jgi:4-hydroxybenzoate polyprenyltransferase
MAEKIQAPEAAHARPGDAVASTWVDRTPPFAQPYFRLMRLDRPIGAWLLYWPCVFGLALGAAADGRIFPDPWSLVLMGIGTIVMRGAGCTYNDIVDRDIDAKVARTRGRPIPSGAVGAKAAFAFAVLLSLAGLAVLITFNFLTIIIGIASLALVAAYPFMKRITWWPQAWLGLTFNWGVLVGYAAETNSLPMETFVLYAGCFFWTLGYDTIYAHQDKEDDALIGVKSSALWLGSRTKPALYIFYALCFALIIAAGWMAGLGVVFALAMLVPGAHMVWQVRALDTERPLLCLKLFKSNRETGALIAVALILGAVSGL